ncbi:RelA/SpoT family protein [Desulfurispira natronophila]|uniref:GTP pyrophosphokinase n=1 Tax=Desulfurispira natronophila TaxID=682562 RepID=A0A7W8DHG7_9BACT|nr:bifunctional (p)ppGpp synthetase/guanosine-3',5'-bis(diphosphate) 3'-pyrophosphohydrolase [Desulfurispira natronophila]MBB5022367.1 GTP pyrophosphokinase [Desulfurispira natronophila]
MTQMIRINDILQEVQRRHKDADLTPINKAYIYAAQAHRGIRRKSGEPYISHPLAVSYLLATMNLDPYTISAGLLHDTIEDTETTFEELQQLFGHDVAFLVDGVTKIETMVGRSNKSSDVKAETLRKMLIAMAKDIRVLLIKLADRLHNIRTLEHMPAEKRKVIGQETLDIYAPLAHRLGINWMKTELEDLSLQHCDPEAYEMIRREVEPREGDRRTYVDELITKISAQLNALGINYEVQGRPKYYYSIYKKIKRQNVTPRELFDLLALRIVTESVSECYLVLGEIHRLWRAVPNRLKDYITNPKSNLYQSLHTTVIGPDGHKVEFQIRTKEMHKIAEEGIAAHWAYKEGVNPENDETQRFAWLKSILEGGVEEFEDSSEFLKALRQELYVKEVYVFTPKGDTIELPDESTVLDFAFSIHSEIGQHCTGAYVNGKMVGIRHQLQNGDTVDVLTSDKQHPRKDWLKFVRTNRARIRINAYLNKMERQKAIESGREILEKGLRRYRKSLESIGSKQRERLVELSHMANLDELLKAIGLYKIDTKTLLEKLFEDHDAKRQQQKEIGKQRDEVVLEGARERQQAVSQGSTIEIKGVSDVLIRVANCCAPLPGDPIVGYVTHGRGISIHKQECPQMSDAFQERLIEANWSEAAVKNIYTANFTTLCKDQPGVLAGISSVLGDNKANITNIRMVKKDTSRSEVLLEFTVEVNHKDQLSHLRTRVRSLPFVLEVK